MTAWSNQYVAANRAAGRPVDSEDLSAIAAADRAVPAAAAEFGRRA
jgi:hypothetical protein